MFKSRTIFYQKKSWNPTSSMEEARAFFFSGTAQIKKMFLHAAVIRFRSYRVEEVGLTNFKVAISVCEILVHFVKNWYFVMNIIVILWYFVSTLKYTFRFPILRFLFVCLFGFFYTLKSPMDLNMYSVCFVFFLFPFSFSVDNTEPSKSAK